jgi:hypothetical protein
MKSKEEIEQLAEEFTNGHYHYRGKDSFIHGYIQCQEDMKKELYEFGKLVLNTFHSEGKTHSGEARLARIKYHEWFNEL